MKMANERECLGFFEPDKECMGDPKAKDEVDRTPCAELEFCKIVKEVAKAKGVEAGELLSSNSRDRIKELHAQSSGKAGKGKASEAPPATPETPKGKPQGKAGKPEKPTKGGGEKPEAQGKTEKPGKTQPGKQEKPQPEKPEKPKKNGKAPESAKPPIKRGKAGSGEDTPAPPEKTKPGTKAKAGEVKTGRAQNTRSAEKPLTIERFQAKAKRFLQPKLKDLGIKVQDLGDGKFKIAEKHPNPFRQGCDWWFVTESYRVGGTPEVVADRAMKMAKADKG
jgi:hypothetical protein